MKFNTDTSRDVPLGVIKILFYILSMGLNSTTRAINRIFTCVVLYDLLQNGSNKVFDYVVQQYVTDPENKTLGEIISDIYVHLGKERRNEYYYTNTLLNKLLVGIHNVNTTTALSQVRIGHHIADFVMINGEGKVYEIKSDLDNFNRLYAQLRDYFKAFSKVCVLTSIHELNRVEQVLASFGDIGEYVGIYVLSENDTIFSKIYSREPQQFEKYLDYNCIFKLLRKNEYENVLLKYFGNIPQVAPAFHFRICLEQFKLIPILTAQNLAFKELKKRNKITKAAFEGIQSELKSAVYFSKLSRKLPALEQLLQINYRG